MTDALVERTVAEVSGGRVFALLPEATQAQIRALSKDDIREGARRVFTRPQPGDVSQAGRLLLNPCLTVQWLAAFEELGLPRALRVFEPCTGSSEPVIFATELYTEGQGSYAALNLNRPLAAQLREKIAKVRLPARIIEENAAGQDAYADIGPVDAACFHHAINDILQTAVSEPRGMDTRAVDWWPNERQMIEWLAEEARENRLDARARPALMDAVRNAVEIVRPGGTLLFDHWTWIGHREMDWFPWELFCDLIPLARAWIAEESLPLTEIPLPGRDPQWWMCFRRA